MAQNKTASYLQAAERPCDFADAARVTDGIVSQVLTFAWYAPQSHIRGAACRNHRLFVEFFIFVPSLSWQTIVFHIRKTAPKTAFPHRQGCSLLSCRWSSRGGRAPAKHACVLSFPYVCPEPVLVKRSFLYINGAKGRVSLRICEANVLLLGAFAWLWWCWRPGRPWRCWGGG